MEQPAVLGEFGKQLRAHGDDPHVVEMPDEVVEQGRGIRRMADGRGDDERHAPAGLQQARRRHEEGRPGCGEPRKLCARAGAQLEGTLARLALEGLVANEGRVARGAFEAFAGPRGPGEEIALVDAGPGSAAHRHGRGFGVLLDAEAVPMGGDEAPVSAGGVEKPVAVLPNHPPHEVRGDGVRRVVGAGLFSREAGHRDAPHPAIPVNVQSGHVPGRSGPVFAMPN